MMSFTLLQTTDVLVSLPERLTDASGMLAPDQKTTTDIAMPPRNIAFWTTKDKKDRPQVHHFRKQLGKFLTTLEDSGNWSSTVKGRRTSG